MNESRFDGLFRPGVEQSAYVRKLAASTGPRAKDNKFQKHVVRRGEYGGDGRTREVQNRLQYANTIKTALNEAGDAFVVKQGNSHHALYRHGESDSVGWVNLESATGGTFFRPVDGNAGYFARKAREAGKGNRRNINLEKARQTRTTTVSKTDSRAVTKKAASPTKHLPKPPPNNGVKNSGATKPNTAAARPMTPKAPQGAALKGKPAPKPPVKPAPVSTAKVSKPAPKPPAAKPSPGSKPATRPSPSKGGVPGGSKPR